MADVSLSWALEFLQTFFLAGIFYLLVFRRRGAL